MASDIAEELLEAKAKKAQGLSANWKAVLDAHGSSSQRMEHDDTAQKKRKCL